MNINTINFNSFQLEIPKISKEQYFLLRLLVKAIEERQIKQNSYFISTDSFKTITKKQLQNLLQDNIEIIITNKASGNWSWFSVVSNIEMTKDIIYFTPAEIIKEIILESCTSSKKTFLKYILFNGIRHKQTLLLLDYLLKLNKNFFEISTEDLRIIFELQLDQYKNFNSLKNFVIDRAVKEINEKTNLNLEYQISQTERRKVVAVSFQYYSKEIK